MSYDLELAAKRAASRLRGLASAWQADDRSGWIVSEVAASDDRRAAQLEEIAASLEEPLQQISQVRECEAARP